MREQENADALLQISSNVDIALFLLFRLAKSAAVNYISSFLALGVSSSVSKGMPVSDWDNF